MFAEPHPHQASPMHAALLGGHHGGGFQPPHALPGQPTGLPPGALLAMILHGLAQHAQQGQQGQPFAHGAPMQQAPLPGLRPPPVFQPPGQPHGMGVSLQPPMGGGQHFAPQPYGLPQQGGGGVPQPPQGGMQPIPRPAPGSINGGPDQPPSRWPPPGVRPAPRPVQPPVRVY